MSINLHCDGFNVIQTPTYITFMIYDDGCGGNVAIKRRYMNYIRYLRQEEFNKNIHNPKAQRDAWSYWTEHIKDCEDAGDLNFSIGLNDF